MLLILVKVFLHFAESRSLERKHSVSRKRRLLEEENGLSVFSVVIAAV